MSTMPLQRVDPALRGFLWRALGRHGYRFTFHNWYTLRRWILKLFGAKLASTVRFRRTAVIDRPWNLQVGRHVVVGDHAIMRCKAPITIGDDCTVSQMTLLCTEARDLATPDGAAKVEPITIDAHCWVAADTLILPGVHLHEGAVIGARSLVAHDVGPWKIAAGQPAEERRPRPFAPENRNPRRKAPDVPTSCLKA